MLHAANPGRHKLSDRKDDLNETPLCAVQALLRHVPLPKKIWEPACGRGAIAGPLVQAGYKVASTDLVDYGYGQPGVDFLMEHRTPDCEAIVTNPPYKLANEFVRHALDLCPRVIMLLRLAFIEGMGRSDILDSGRLDFVWVFKNRLPMMHREGWEGPKIERGSIPYAWFDWGAKAAGLPKIIRIEA